MTKKPEIKIHKFDSETFLNLLTGEVLPIEHTESRADSKTSVKQFLRNLRDLLNANIENTENCRWLTLTYRENMKDTKRLYDDTRKFHMRMRYYLKQNCLSHYEYIECAEPQARGAWYMHIVMIFVEVEQAPFIPNETIEKIWSYGFTVVGKSRNGYYEHFLMLSMLFPRFSNTIIFFSLSHYEYRTALYLPQVF